MTLSTYQDTLASLTHPMGNITFHPSDIYNRINEKMVHCCKPAQTWWSLNRLTEHGVKFGERIKADGQLLKSTRNISWESCHLKYYHKYSGGDGQSAAVPDNNNNNNNDNSNNDDDDDNNNNTPEESQGICRGPQLRNYTFAI